MKTPVLLWRLYSNTTVRVDVIFCVNL